MPLAWRTRSPDNGLLGALETVDHFLESGDPLLALGQGTRRKKQKTSDAEALFRRLACPSYRPATTSSPWASNSNSMTGCGAPVEGSRETQRPQPSRTRNFR